MSDTKLVLKIILDFFILFCVAFPLLAFMLWAEPYHRGYFQTDVSLRLPFKDELISTGLMAGVGFGIAVVVIIITEMINEARNKAGMERAMFGLQLPAWIWESYCVIGVFVFGAACQQLTSTIAKYVIGRLRPHFHHLCNPLPTHPILDITSYIEEYQCVPLTNNDSLLVDMRLSFPSAHASFSMFVAVFISLYIHLYWNWRGSKLLRHGVQLVLMLASWFVGLSRIQDNMHHWDDVVAGYLIGAFYGVLVFIFVLKPKKLNQERDDGQTFEEAIAQQRELESRLPRAILVNSTHYR